VLAERVKQPRLIIWLGSDIGQMDYAQAADLLKNNLLPWLNPEDRVLIGIDLKKSAQALEIAYGCNASKSLNKSFSANPLVRINREFNGNFQLEDFKRCCYYDAAKGCVKVYLECIKAQQVLIQDLNFEVNVAQGEHIRIHCGYKYDQADLEKLAQDADLKLDKQWFDNKYLFSLNFFSPNLG